MLSSPGLGGQGREQTPGGSTLTQDCCREWLQTDQWRIDGWLALFLSALVGNKVPYLGWNRLLVFIWTFKYSRKQAAEGGVVSYLTILIMKGLKHFAFACGVLSRKTHIWTLMQNIVDYTDPLMPCHEPQEWLRTSGLLLHASQAGGLILNFTTSDMGNISENFPRETSELWVKTGMLIKNISI